MNFCLGGHLDPSPRFASLYGAARGHYWHAWRGIIVYIIRDDVLHVYDNALKW